jgi:hypothetical protein
MRGPRQPARPEALGLVEEFPHLLARERTGGLLGRRLEDRAAVLTLVELERHPHPVAVPLQTARVEGDVKLGRPEHRPGAGHLELVVGALGRDAEVAAVLGVQERPEHARGVEAGQAQPVDGPVRADERGRLEVADQAVVADERVLGQGPLPWRAG